MTSAYPTPVGTLIEKVRALADRDGSPPSRNRIMAEFHVGARKANDALAGLGGYTAETTSNPDPGSAEPTLVPTARPNSRAGSSPRLRAVQGDDQAPAESAPDPVADPSSVTPEPNTADVLSAQTTLATNPGSTPTHTVRSWPLFLLALPAFVAIWSGWVGLGGLTGFGPIHPLPGIADDFTVNSAITLPVGVETYAAYALNVWLSGHNLVARARRFAKWSALGSLALGAAGQVAYHVMTAAGVTHAPWQITTLVSCLPVVVLGCGAALRHLVRAGEVPA